MPVVTLGGFFTAVPPPHGAPSRGGWLYRRPHKWAGKSVLPHSITAVRRYSPGAIPPGCAGMNRHEPALDVSAPTDIQGGDEVADQRPTRVSDVLSVRNYPSELSDALTVRT